jgi:hypothetical protein
MLKTAIFRKKWAVYPKNRKNMLYNTKKKLVGLKIMLTFAAIT